MKIRNIELSEEEAPTLIAVRKLKEENKNLSEENRFLKNALRELSQIVYGDRERIV